jgi:hypothetical protein
MSEVTIHEERSCDFCGETAEYDARTIFGPWANMCQECFDGKGIGQLGTGFGQRLVLSK